MILHQFIRNLSWNGLGKLSVLITSFAVSIIISRYLGNESLGIYSSILVIPAMARLLSSFGLERVLNTKLQEYSAKDAGQRAGRFLLRKVISIRVIASLVFCLLLYFLIPAYTNFVGISRGLTFRNILLVYFFLTTFNSILSIIFMSYLRFKVTSMSEALNGVLNLVFLLFFTAVLDMGIPGVLYAYILAMLVNTLIFGFMAVPYIAGETERTELNDAWRIAGVAYVSGVIGFGLLNQSDIVIMNFFHIAQQSIGYYHLATGFAGMLTFVLTGIGPLALTLFSKTFANGSHAALSSAWRQIVGFVFFCTTPVYLFAFFFSKEMIIFLYGEQFSPSGDAVMVYLCLIVMTSLIGSAFSGDMLYVVRKQNIVLRATLEGSLLNVVLDIILIPRFREIGAVAATGISMFYIGARQTYAMRQVIAVGPIYRFIGRYFLLALGAATATKMISVILASHVLWDVLVYFIIYTAFLLIFKPLTRDQVEFAAKAYPQMNKWIFCFAR